MLQKPSSCVGCALYEPPFGKKTGFSRPDGSGLSGVMIIAEALGESEEEAGIALIGKAGHYLFQQLKRVGIERDDFTLFNCVACRPPNNKLAKQPYELEALSHCAPNLDHAIVDARATARTCGKHFTILTLGRIAFKRIMGFTDKSPVMHNDYLCYPFWNEKYQAWVIAADHPSYLMRGNHHLVPLLQFAATRALEIADKGMTFDSHQYLLDPDPGIFQKWIEDYYRVYDHDPLNTFMSYDIETPYKQGKDEEEVAREDDDDYSILRCSFAYRPNEAVSVPWRAEYQSCIEEIFAHDGPMVGWNCPTPDQKILTADLRWVPAGDLKVGDKLVGIDENVPDGFKYRRYKTSIVTHASRGKDIVTEIKFSDGSIVKVTPEHPWLLAQRHKPGKKLGGSSWTLTKDLKVGQIIQKPFNEWSNIKTWDAGYLAGFFDGEGYLSTTTKDFAGLTVGAAQNTGTTLNNVFQLLSKYGFNIRTKTHKREKDKNCTNFIIPNGKRDSARFLGSIRPQRLLNKFKPEFLGAAWNLYSKLVSIISITNLGEKDIVKLSTDEHTYVLGGFIAHNSQNYDLPRVRAQVVVNGDQIDGMLAWHVLNSSLRKGLGFVAPFYAQTSGVWKWMSSEAPAFYNAKDADIALRCFLGTRKDMKDHDLWHVFERHVIELNRVFDYMSKQGVTRDEVMRAEAETKLAALLDAVETKMQAAVPEEALRASPKNGYTRQPKSIEGMVQRTFTVVEKACPKCGVIAPKKSDYLLCGSTKADLIPVEVSVERWCKLVPFKVSKLGILNYQRELRHQAIVNRKENKITFDENAITRLMKKYPNDPLYPTILEHRGHQKLLSTYIGVTDSSGRTRGGMPIGRDGRIHTLFTCNPSTLRSASQNPNLQNLPRPKGIDDLATIIRNLIVAGPGHIFTARDYSGIEAVLVGYFALSPRYIRLSKIDVHSFYTAYGLHQLDGRIGAADLPDFNWSDERLIPHLAAIKKEFKTDRNNLYKHLVHGANFMQGAKGAAEKIFSETGIEYPVATVGKVMGVYFELFPEIKKWHKNVLLQADKDGFLRNPFGYVHRFSKVYEYEKIGGEWKKEPGPQANQVIAFLPQSSAAGIIKEAMLRLYFNRFDEAGQYLRLLVHDELFSEVPVGLISDVDAVMMEEMERPIEALPLPMSYGMGKHLIILTESKKGERWGSMK